LAFRILLDLVAGRLAGDDLSRIAPPATILDFSRTVSVTCFMPALLRRWRGIAAFVPDDLEQVLGDLAGDCAVRSGR
jgi:hypothetical protein